ncbi:polysaccharide pyruvyl transferase CsaB [Geitlerinema sp. PCC 9228]|uniref:polysaccharide pyruvyl transferase CsaB n=1 Tax=Geitlerinema sp. PCC 9228 TaxID=111611 RepID=UPI0008F9A7F2|nr:polysaccharide pyruvyl transferase CsaB [Geitlerinema sp. PCC 9228]
MVKAVICGYYGKGNAGDEALLASLLQMLPQHVVPLVLSAEPVRTRRRYRVQTCDRMSAWLVWRALRQADALILGGGSLFQDATSWRSPLYYAGIVGLAQGMGLKTIAWGQGIGPLQRRFVRNLTRRAFSRCTAVSVRDVASAELLRQWQVNCTLAPDPVWALQEKPAKHLADLPAPRVAVTLRSHRALTPPRLDTIVKALIAFQKATDTCILLIPFQQSQDRAIAERIQPQLPDSSHIVDWEDPRELKGIYNGVEMVIGMRFHALLMASAAACRCFAISYDPKVTQFMQDFEVPGWELQALPEDAQEMTQAWLEHYANGEALTAAQIEAYRDRCLLHQEFLAEAFRENSY